MAVTHLVNLDPNDSLDAVIRKCNRNFYLVSRSVPSEVRTVVGSPGGSGGGGGGTAIIDLTAQINSINRTISSMRSRLDALEGASTALRKDVSDLSIEVDSLGIKVTSILTDLSAVEDDVSYLTTSLAALKQTVADLPSKDDIIDDAYPIGSIIVSTVDPTTTLGIGAWEQGEEVTVKPDGSIAYFWQRSS